ncbi:MAG: hypothetical protein M3500_11110 [Actinomycetota bacterium]|nr:hypothetical protein [Actinomycetota bacterium]
MPAVFVFDSDGDLNVFPSLETASGWMEAVDVDNGEYAAAFLHNGTVVQMSTLRERVVLTASDTRDTLQLQQFLDSYPRRTGRPIGGNCHKDSTMPPHYGAKRPGHPMTHHTYPTRHDPERNR